MEPGVTLDPALDRRTPISDGLRAAVITALTDIPQGKRGALLVTVDETGTARATVAGNIAGNWKVAATAGVTIGRMPTFAGMAWVEGSW